MRHGRRCSTKSKHDQRCKPDQFAFTNIHLTTTEASSLAGLHTLLEKMARENFALPGSECSTITEQYESGEAGDHELEAALKTDSEFDKSAEVRQ